MTPERVRRALSIAAIICMIAGSIAMKDYFDGTATWLDAVYAAAQLFTLTSPFLPGDDRHVPLILEILRFVAPVLAASAVVATFTSVARSWMDLTRARRMSGHQIVCGDSVASIEIAIALAAQSAQRGPSRGTSAQRTGRSPVLAIAEEFPESTVDRLRENGVRVLHTSCDSNDFRRAMRGTAQVIVGFSDDPTTLRWSIAAGEALREDGVPAEPPRVQALLRRPLRAGLMNQIDLAGIELSSVVERVAQGAISLVPLQPAPTGPPRALLIADAAAAAPLADRLWASAARGVPPLIDVFGPAVPSSVAGFAPPDFLNYHTVPWSDVAAAASAHLRDAQASQPIGNPVYVWTGDPSLDIEVALALIAAAPGTHATIVSDSVQVPRSTSSRPDGDSGIGFVGVHDSVVTGQLVAVTRPDRVARSLVNDVVRFGGGRFVDVEGPHPFDGVEIPDLATLQYGIFHRLAEAVVQFAPTIGLTVGPWENEPLLLTPAEIDAFATEFEQLLPKTADRVSLLGRSPYFDLASRLPNILQFAGLGFSPTSPDDARSPRFSRDHAKRLAPLIHNRYALRNGEFAGVGATAGGFDPNLGQALDFPLKLALVGYELCALDQATLEVPADASPGRAATPWLPMEHAAQLAELEHRRWSRDRRMAGWVYSPVRDNGQRHHPDLVPYDQLSADSQDKDLQPVLDMPRLLSEIGFGIRPVKAS